MGRRRPSGKVSFYHIINQYQHSLWLFMLTWVRWNLSRKRTWQMWSYSFIFLFILCSYKELATCMLSKPHTSNKGKCIYTGCLTFYTRGFSPSSIYVIIKSYFCVCVCLCVSSISSLSGTKMLQVYLVYFLPVPELVIPPRIPGSLYWRMVLNSKICVLGVLIAIWVSLFLKPFQRKEQDKLCMYTHLCTSVYTYL